MVDINKEGHLLDILNIHINRGMDIIKLYSNNNNVNNYEMDLNNWIVEGVHILKKLNVEDSFINEFRSNTMININRASNRSTIINFHKSINKGINILNIIRDTINEKDLMPGEVNKIDREVALVIIRRVLKNFYKHIQSMYYDIPHGSGGIKKEDLDKVRIKNEYDVQRILYSLLRPIFPNVRQEVDADSGYKGIRYDIFLDEYNVVIEVKCTRSSMKERNLTEEIGSDVFHYKHDYVFFFIFDKENIVKNIDSFSDTYTKDKKDCGKDIETIVVQQVIL